MTEGFISRNPLGLFARVFKRSNADIKRLFKQKGLYVYRNGRNVLINTHQFTIYQDEILRIGREYTRVHSDMTIQIYGNITTESGS
jgi:hypothetical protein